MNKYVFGPIISRRLGVSLGVDLVSHKVCSLDCVYCECGKTRTLTKERKEYNSVKEILSELDTFLSDSPVIDYITLTGSGEPTLNSGIKDIIDYLKQKYPQYKIAILTNGTLLCDEDVQNDIMNADLVVPSFDAYTQSAFEKINKPFPGIDNEKIIKGLIDFTHKFKGKIWIEIFIITGINDSFEEILKMKSAIEKMNFEKIQLNTLDRCGAEEWVKETEIETLERIADLLSPLNVEIIRKIKTKKNSTKIELNEKNVTDILKRRPCTIEDFEEIFDADKNSIDIFMQKMVDNKKIVKTKLKRGEFFKLI